MMKRKLIFVWLLSASLIFQARGQQPAPRKWQAVVTPPERVLVTIANQPGSPLKFEDIQHLSFVDGGGSPSFLVHNVGTKPIRSFTVGSSGWTLGWAAEPSTGPLLPGGGVSRPVVTKPKSCP